MGGQLFKPEGHIGSFDDLSQPGSTPTYKNSPKLPTGLWVGEKQCPGAGQAGKTRIMGLVHRAVTAQDQATIYVLHTLPCVHDGGQGGLSLDAMSQETVRAEGKEGKAVGTALTWALQSMVAPCMGLSPTLGSQRCTPTCQCLPSPAPGLSQQTAFGRAVPSVAVASGVLLCSPHLQQELPTCQLRVAKKGQEREEEPPLR